MTGAECCLGHLAHCCCRPNCFDVTGRGRWLESSSKRSNDFRLDSDSRWRLVAACKNAANEGNTDLEFTDVTDGSLPGDTDQARDSLFENSEQAGSSSLPEGADAEVALDSDDALGSEDSDLSSLDGFEKEDEGEGGKRRRKRKRKRKTRKRKRKTRKRGLFRLQNERLLFEKSKVAVRAAQQEAPELAQVQ